LEGAVTQGKGEGRAAHKRVKASVHVYNGARYKRNHISTDDTHNLILMTHISVRS
jgi:hypothetical protein